MVYNSKKLFFNTITITLDDMALFDAARSGDYSRITAISYKKYDLPGFRVRTKTTALIDLKASEDDIFAKFNDTTRNEIRKTYKNDRLEFREPRDDSEEREVYGMYREFEFGQGRVPVSFSEMKLYRCFAGFLDGEPVSAMYVVESKPYLRLRSIFSKRLKTDDKESYKTMSNASRRVIWEICRWGKANGFESLDMASVNFENPKTASITKFKMSFGGDVIEEYTHIYKSSLFGLLEKLVSVKLKIMKLMK